jgi:hypothetical protein
MKEWIAEYVKGCATCQQSKVQMHKRKTPIFCIGTDPDMKPFQVIAMDLITGLPPYKEYDAILTIMDHGCSRAAVFIPCSTTITRSGVAQIYFDHIYHWFGLPTKIITNRDPRFTSHFGKAMAKALGVQQNISTAFHPQTDGLTEQMNQWVEGYLRLITTGQPDHWAEWLLLASAVHNNHLNQTLKLSPNQILWGHEATLLPTNTHQTSNEAMEKRMALLKRYQERAISAIQELATGSGTPPEQYQVGDAVWLKAKNLKLPHQTSKLTPK